MNMTQIVRFRTEITRDYFILVNVVPINWQI